MIRPIRPTDIVQLGRHQKLVFLDLPNTLVRDFSPLRFATRSSLGPARAGADTLIATSKTRPVACCYSYTP
ncbi:MAG: hypothetical protein M3281_02305, partial [Chloroflexota bacterium]|nr:hypothetical protein [Chloroflexota bacterium]